VCALIKAAHLYRVVIKLTGTTCAEFTFQPIESDRPPV